MNKLTENEKKALELMQKDNFRGISKDNVMQLVSILDKVDPSVAKELIAQMPEAIRCMIETEKTYAGILSAGIVSGDNSLASCYSAEDSIIRSLQTEAAREGTTFEQKKYYFEKMEEAVQRKEKKDSEHKNFILRILKFGAYALFWGFFIVAGIFFGKVDFKNPHSKA